MSFETVKDPITIRGITFPNRIVFPPVQTNYAAANGETTNRLVDFYTKMAGSNVGLTIVGATGISPTSRLGDHALCLYDEKQTTSAERLFSEIRKGGSIPAVQLNHGGRVMQAALAAGKIVGPSAIPSPGTGVVPHALTTAEVEEIIDDFVSAAVNAQKAGALMVEFHGAHSFLLNQFLSPAANQRDDKYGGNTHNRGLIVNDILRRTRAETGEDLILGLRMSVDEYSPDGLALEESCQLINHFIDNGLDIIHVSAGGMDSGGKMIEEAEKGNLINLAAKVKEEVAVPVIAVGGVIQLAQAEAALSGGLADMVAIGRGLIADPELVSKSLEGRSDTVNECTSCMQCFAPSAEPGMTCSVNEDL